MQQKIPQCTTAILGLLLAAFGLSQAAPYQNLRFNEDPDAVLEAMPEDVWASLKKIDVTEDFTLSLGGQARVRWELWDNFGFAPGNDDDFFLTRLRLHGDLRMGEDLRLFVEGKSALASDRDLPGGKRGLDEDELDLQNAFLELTFDALTLRGGRQELQFGRQRLISPLDWTNTRRTFEGGTATYAADSYRLDLFATRFVPVDKDGFNEGDSDIRFHGIYATSKDADMPVGAEAYLLLLDKKNVKLGDAVVEEERYTLGVHLIGPKDAPLQLDAEAAYQFGDFGDLDIGAWMVAFEAAHVLKDLPGAPKLVLGLDYASGDDDPTDGDRGTFNQLFPLGHAYHGFIDAVGRQNVFDFSQSLICKLPKGVIAKLDHHWLQRVEAEDAWYNAGGGVVRPGVAGSDKDLGNEIDLTLVYGLNAHTKCWVGYSHFFAGDFVKESGPSEDVDFVYTTVQYTF